LRLCSSILFFLFLVFPAFAQDALDDGVVTADEVNIVAQRLYCPVCPNERLDACQTAACASWREDIRRQLEAGQTEDEIVADFVRRYGERAAGTPLDPTLRALSIYTPYIFAVIALMLGVVTFLRWRGQRSIAKMRTEGGGSLATDTPDEAYRQLLERDLNE
jgi:cytochrome c-type biogenesis protein CcmH/NrfF